MGSANNWYLFISFWLINDYPLNQTKFDPNKTYNLIKDTLTLVAYFLTPAVAWALFTDWKELHLSKIFEDESMQIYDGIEHAFTSLFLNLYLVDDEQKFKNNNNAYVTQQIELFLEKIEILKSKNKHLKARGAKAKEFTDNALKILEDLENSGIELLSLYTYQLKIQNPKDHKDLEYSLEDFTESMKEKYDGLYDQIENDSPKLNEMKDSLKILCDDLKIKV